MSRYAKVGSVDRLKEFRGFLGIFADKAASALDEASSDIRRAALWLKQDRLRYWNQELRKRTEKFTQAKLALKYKKDIEISPLGGHPSYVDEKKAFDIAKRNLEEAQEKLENVKHWIGVLEKETYAYRGQVQGLNNLVDMEIPNARTLLDNMVISLEDYAALEAPSVGPDGLDLSPSGLEGDATEAAASMTRSANARPTISVHTYLPLRKKTPRPLDRAQVRITTGAGRWVGGMEISPQLVTAAAGMAKKHDAVTEEAMIVLTRNIGDQRRIYLERTDPHGPGDSGWYVGIIDETQVFEYEGARAGDILDVRPDLEKLFSLPVGTMVILDGKNREIIIDPDDKLVWVNNQ